MSVSCRIIVWLIPSLLVCGGCATPVLLQPPTSVDDSPTEVTGPAPMVDAEAALIHRAALDSGFTETEAGRIEQSIIRANPQDRAFLTRYIYSQLNRQQGVRSGPDAPSATTPHETREPITLSPDSYHAQSRGGSDGPKAGPQGAVSTASDTERVVSNDEPTTTRPATGALTASQNHHTAPASRVGPPSTDRDDTADRAPPTVAANQATYVRATPSSANEPANESTDTAEISWQRQLRLAATHLRRELAERKDLDPLDESRMRACLSLLQLVAEDPERAMESLEGLDDHELEFWRQTILGLNILMDSDAIPKLRHRVENASTHLQDGITALSRLGPLRLENLAFVDAVEGYGVYNDIGGRGFAPGEPVIVYVEVSNYTVDEIPTGEPPQSRRRRAEQVPMVGCDLLGRCDILDQNQRIVLSRTLGVTQDRWRKPLRDFFIPYDFTFPDLRSGDYTFELTIEDRKGQKFGNASIGFRIR